MKYLSLRTWLGALFFLIFVGEPTVGFHSGLFTSPASFITLLSLYVVLFLLYEALVIRFHLTNLQLVLLTFAIYSVVITGLLHGEIGNYARHPQQDLITTLIRIQSSLFPPFAYYILNKIRKRRPDQVLTVGKALLVAAVYVLILTPTHKFGLTKAVETFRDAPLEAIGYSLAALACLGIALKPSRARTEYRTTALTVWTWVLLVVALIPLPAFFVILALAMPLVMLVYVRVPSWRHAGI